MYTTRKVMILALGTWLGFAGMARAVCNQSSASTADANLWSVHGCWQDFYLWSYKAYDQSSSDWGNRGWNDACNKNLEFPKHWNAAYLLTYGLADASCCSFHGTTDYRKTAEAAETNFHDDLYHMCSDDSCCFGHFNYHWYGANELGTHCALYNASSANGNPGSRAGDFIHEGWHGWQEHHGYDGGSCGGHMCGPVGACTLSSGCDWWYWHGIGAFAFGEMWKYTSDGKYFHSPNQAQVEFLCDVADYPKSWVPASVRQAAKSDADTRASQRFRNGPGYKCGNPRPW